MIQTNRHVVSVLVLLCIATVARASGPTPLFARGYTVIPEPQNVELTGSDFAFGSDWQLVLDAGVQSDSVPVDILRDDLASRYGIHLQTPSHSVSSARVVKLSIR